MIISLMQFVINEERLLNEFADWWMQHHVVNPYDFPNMMQEADFIKQFEFYLDQQYPGRNYGTKISDDTKDSNS